MEGREIFPFHASILVTISVYFHSLTNHNFTIVITIENTNIVKCYKFVCGIAGESLFIFSGKESVYKRFYGPILHIGAFNIEQKEITQHNAAYKEMVI